MNDAPKGIWVRFREADAVLNLLDVGEGYLVPPSRMHYRLLQLGGTSSRMTLPVLRKIRDLVQNGATVVGAPPVDSPSLADNMAEFHRLKAEIWGSDKGVNLSLGHVVANSSVEEVLSTEGISPDLTYSGASTATELMFVHRILSDGEIYFLANRRNQNENVDVSFRVTNKSPELWHAETGIAEPATFRIENGRTGVPLRLNLYDAVFVVFRKPALAVTRIIPEPMSQTLTVVKVPWTVSFQSARGAPASTVFDQLESWSHSSNPGVKYFSGTATYTRDVVAPAAWFRHGVIMPGRTLVFGLDFFWLPRKR